MEWWVAELLRAAVLVGGVVLVQQLIRRHGVDYVAHIFQATPQAGRAFLALADIAYYLIVVAYTLFAVRVERPFVDDSHLQGVVQSVAGLSLLIGVLHMFNLLLLPAVARSLAKRRSVAA